MCGIFGAVTNKQTDFDLEKIKASLLNRGPDGEGRFCDSKVTLLHTRLSIIDIKNGVQPFYNEDSTIVCIANGEIFNFAQIKKELILVGHQFRTDNDCEVLVHLYEEDGIEGFKKLEGIFAFAIYVKDKQVILGRDPVGVKPLYYWFQNDELVFASVVKALIKHPHVKTNVNISALLQHEVFDYWMDYQTLFEGIYEVKPGHVLVFALDSHLRMQEIKYIDLFSEQEIFIMQKEEAIEHLVTLLQKGFAMNLLSDVSIATLLSGGLDSTILACAVSRFGKIPALTMGVPESPDWQTAQVVTQHLQIPHQFYHIKMENYLKDLPYIIRASESFFKGAAIYYSALLAKDQFKVLLCGEGADELFAGYSSYANPTGWLERMNYNARILSRRGVPPESMKYINELLSRMNSLRSPLLLTEFMLRQWFQFQLNVKHLMPFDHLSMENGVEIRVPYLYSEVVKFAFSLPVQYKIGQERKYILRRAGEKICPHEIFNLVNSRPKVGFPSTIFQYIEPELNRIIGEKISDQYLYNHPFIRYFCKKDKNAIFYFDLFYHIFFNKLGDVNGDEVEDVFQGNIY